jgi:hypothetical protein
MDAMMKYWAEPGRTIGDEFDNAVGMPLSAAVNGQTVTAGTILRVHISDDRTTAEITFTITEPRIIHGVTSIGYSITDQP